MRREKVFETRLTNVLYMRIQNDFRITRSKHFAGI